MEPVVSEAVFGYKEVHDDMRVVARELGADGLNWQPAPETNSIAVLIVHTLGSEREVLHTVAGAPLERDRDAEFRVAVDDRQTLLAALDDADALLDRLAPTITAADLTARRPRGDNPPETGARWLISNYGHAREHLAQIALTRQLYEATTTP